MPQKNNPYVGMMNEVTPDIPADNGIQTNMASDPEPHPGIWERLTSPTNPSLENFRTAHPVLSSPLRAVDSAGAAGLSLPGALVHAFTDPLTEEEKKEFQGHTRIPGEVTAERLTGAPLVRGIQQYLNPSTRPTMRQAVSVLPEAIGTGAGNVAAGEIAGSSLEPAKNAAGIVKDAFTEKGNPNLVYHKYLDPVSDTPHPMPPIVPRMAKKLSLATQYTDPGLASRITSGDTTLGDLDRVRIEANQMSKAAYKDNAPMAPATARGAAGSASAIRDAIYPHVETMHDLPEGALGKLKGLEGDRINILQKSPDYDIHNPQGWIPVAVKKLLIDAPRLGLNRLQTAALTRSLPEPVSAIDRSSYRLALPERSVTSGIPMGQSTHAPAGPPSFTESTNPFFGQKALPEKATGIPMASSMEGIPTGTMPPPILRLPSKLAESYIGGAEEPSAFPEKVKPAQRTSRQYAYPKKEK